MFLSSCGDRYTKLCHADKLFCNRETTWPLKFKQETSLELYILDLRYSRVTGGGNAAIEHELSTRGSQAVKQILDYMNGAEDIDTYLFIDVLDQIRYSSKVNICQDDIAHQIITILGRESVHDINGLNSNKRIKEFTDLCPPKKA
jgi:hypothetical protein